MAIKAQKPVTNGMRFRVNLSTTKELTKPQVKKLLVPIKKTGGRSRGKISVRGRGGGHKRMYRLIDFKRHEKVNVEATVLALEYDPNRSGHIALLEYEDGEKRYIVAPQDLKVGDKVFAGTNVKPRVGNAMPLSKIPLGTEVHNVELNPGGGSKVVRSAGQSARVAAKEGDYATLTLPSGEVRLVPLDCYATIGRVSNSEHSQIVHGKAGAKRHLGRRPKVRGVAMSAGDHPHGGGEGRTGPGRAVRDVWGKVVHGVPTRNKKKKSSRFIVKSRKDRK